MNQQHTSALGSSPEAYAVTLNQQQLEDLTEGLRSSCDDVPMGHYDEARRRFILLESFSKMLGKPVVIALLFFAFLFQAGAQSTITIPADTEVDVRFAQTVSSGDAHIGDRIPFTVERDVKVNGVTVIPEGATARGTVTLAKKKKWAGRAGQLGWSVDSVTLPSGQVLLLKGSMERKAEGHGTAVTAGVTAAVFVLPVAAPFVLMVHGHDFTVPQGYEYPAFVDHDTVITAAAAATAAVQ